MSSARRCLCRGFLPRNRADPPDPGHSTDQEHRHHEKLPGPQVAAQLSRLILSALSCDNGNHHVRVHHPVHRLPHQQTPMGITTHAQNMASAATTYTITTSGGAYGAFTAAV